MATWHVLGYAAHSRTCHVNNFTKFWESEFQLSFMTKHLKLSQWVPIFMMTRKTLKSYHFSPMNSLSEFFQFFQFWPIDQNLVTSTLKGLLSYVWPYASEALLPHSKLNHWVAEHMLTPNTFKSDHYLLCWIHFWRVVFYGLTSRAKFGHFNVEGFTNLCVNLCIGSSINIRNWGGIEWKESATSRTLLLQSISDTVKGCA